MSNRERVERYFLEEQQREEEEQRREEEEQRRREEERKREEESENRTDAQVPSSSTLVASASSSSTIMPGNHEQALTDVYVPQSRYVVSMNTRDFSSIVASELRNIYMERFHLDETHMPELRRRYGVPEEFATAYDDAHAVLNYGAAVEQWNRERLHRYRRQE
ncbi:hypothetical protein IHE45_03G046700 [Dioscorea alata]|uniref:Uncharacterized protein n=1 Tax=Dioscorea alata TaxID=55571 RepID=A0ACB7WK73_DIOAL|nr:hypothetical protein IHE45_03G046700 [Dioscorea alata]